MWVAYLGLRSSWQTSLDPEAPWTPLTPFEPAPPAIALRVAAGHSPNGRVQLWTISNDGNRRLQSTWKTSADPNSGWTGWQVPFVPDPGPLYDVEVGQLSDDRMQLWAISQEGRLLSTWKTSKEPGASWADWQRPFIPDPGQVHSGIAVGHSPDGRVQLFVIGLRPSTNDLNTLLSTWKMSGEPDSGWFAWQVPFIPDPGDISDVAVGQLSDGRMQLWAVSPELISTWKTSTDPGASWADWQVPFIPEPAPVVPIGVAAGQLSDGRLKLWVLMNPGDSPPLVSTCQKLSADPNAGWTDWQVLGYL